MKILTVQFSSVFESEISSLRERRAVEGQEMTLPREKAPNVAGEHFYFLTKHSPTNSPPRVAMNCGIKLCIIQFPVREYQLDKMFILQLTDRRKKIWTSDTFT